MTTSIKTKPLQDVFVGPVNFELLGGTLVMGTVLVRYATEFFAFTIGTSLQEGTILFHLVRTFP